MSIARPSVNTYSSALHRLGKALWVSWRGVRLLVTAAPRAFFPYLTLVFILGTIPVAQSWISKIIVDSLTGNANEVHVLLFSILFTITLVISAGMQPIQMSASAWVENRAVGEVDRAQIQAGILMSDLYLIERPAFADKLRLIQDTFVRIPQFVPAITSSATILITLFGLLILLAGLHPVLSIVLFILAISTLR